MGADFDETRVVDRAKERDQFDNFVRADCGPRLMTIKAPPHHGKSMLMELLEYRANYRIQLDGQRVDAVRIVLTDQPDSNLLVDELAERLRRVFVPLPNFERVTRDYYERRLARPFLSQTTTESSVGGDVALVKGDNVQIVIEDHSGDASGDPFYRRQLADALVEDLRQACQKQTIVILIDQFEKSDEENDVTNWVHSLLASSVFVDPAPHRGLALVLASSHPAGAVRPELLKKLAGPLHGSTRCQVIDELSTFTHEDVRKFCELMEVTVTDDFIKGATALIESGATPPGALATFLLNSNGKKSS